MIVNTFWANFLIFGLLVSHFNISLGHPPNYSNLPTAVGSARGLGGHVISQLNQHNKNSAGRPNFSHLISSQARSMSALTTPSFSSPLLSTKSLPDGSSQTLNTSLQSTYVYKAIIPMHIQPEFNKIVSDLKLSNSTSPPRIATNSSTITLENDEDLSKKTFDSSVVTSVSVILKGNEPEFTDALGQKVAKPQPSLQVASPIDLLNPDRYEFYTFDEYGELVKRLMTIEEIQSIVANGDGDGPTIIHHGAIEGYDSEKNVQDIVNSVQSVLNKEVESNKNTSMENLPIFDTPDVSSTWSMILPAIFGNTVGVDIFSHHKPQQIVMTPESEIIETSTEKIISAPVKKSKPSKRKPGQKRKTTTTTEMTPQVIQEELDSKESVYTGMQQYQNLAASMQNYNGLSQVHMQPIFHKLPEIEATTPHVFINNQKVVKNSVATDHKIESLLKKPASVQNKPVSFHHINKPNGSQTPTKQSQSIKKEEKPALNPTFPITATPSTSSVLPATGITTSGLTESSVITTAKSTTAVVTIATPPEVIFNTSLSTTSTLPPNSMISADSMMTSSIVSTTKPFKKKKKPIRNRINSTITIAEVSKPHLTTEKTKPSPHPHRRRPNPSNIYNNKIHSFTFSSTETMVTSTTLTAATMNPVDTSVVIDFPENHKTVFVYESSLQPPKASTNKFEEASLVNIPTTSVTSGYPIPSYNLRTDEPENFDYYQHKKHLLSSQNSSRKESKPYQQDVHALQSFGQIMQTLKYPSQTSEKLNVNTDQSSDKLNVNPFNFKSSELLKSSPTSNPVYYKSSTSKDFEFTRFPYSENTSIKDESSKPNHKTTVGPSLYFSTNNPENIVSSNPIEKATTYTTDVTESYGLIQFVNSTKESFILTDFPVKQAEVTTVYQDFTQKPESQTYSTPFSFTEALTIKNEDQIKIESRLPESFLYKDKLVGMDSKYSSNPILVANLKPQLNIDILKPTEQINMSDFQTQAATVASTLIDGVNTLPSDNSKKNNNEITLLLPGVIHQISNNNEDSKKQVINFIFNRFSNKVHPDLSSLTSSSKDKNQLITSADCRSAIGSGNQPSYKESHERFENQQVELEIENQLNDINSYFGTTKTPETFKESQEFYTESEQKSTEQYTTVNDVTRYQPESVNGIYTLQSCDEGATVVYSEENDTITQINTVLEQKPITMSVPIAITLDSYYQQQKIEDDREPLYKVESSEDTSTLFNRFPEETTTLFGEENFNGGKEEESLSDKNIMLSTTTLISPDKATSAETNKEKIELVNNESSTNIVETDVLVLRSTTTKEALNTEHYQPGPYHIPTNRITEYVNQEKYTQTKENKDETKNGIEKYTTTIHQMSEETSAEEARTDESLGEGPYIKLGETTTSKPSSVNIQTILASATDQDIKAPPNTIQTRPEIGAKPNLFIANYNSSYEESDQEDDEDQLGNFFSNPLNGISGITFLDAKWTTTGRPKDITTHRLNTLKPVSYFNKQPAYALYQEPVSPLYNKHPYQISNTLHTENTLLKGVSSSIPTLQQRPMQRPPQLSNLMISTTQSTRPPIKLGPSPFNSKGLEASLANLNEDILIFSNLCNELAFNYWQSITSEKVSSARSLVMSPFALTSMLSMVFLGARGNTSGEMNDVLKLDDMVTFNPHLIFKNITDSVEKSLDREIATTAFVRQIYSERANGKILQFFKEKTQQLYAGHVEEVNFHVVNDIIRRRTNLLVKRHTMGKVLEYLRTNSVWVNGPLATISANLFQTDCSHGSTQDRDGEIYFQVHPTVRQRRLVPVPAVLFKTGFTAGYEPNLDATVVAFGRTIDITSVIYVIPGHLNSISPSDNLDRLEKQLMETAISKNAWSSLLTSLMARPGMEVQIPRFSHRSFINATTGLQKLGLRGLFKSDYADLGGLTGSSNRDIYLSDMIQINTYSTCGEEKIADHHHIELYPAPPLRKRNKDVDAHYDNDQDSSEAVIDFGSIVQDAVLGRGFYDDLLDPKYLELPLPLRPRQARVPEAPRIRFDRPFLYFVRHNPTGMILFMGRFNPRLLP